MEGTDIYVLLVFALLRGHSPVLPHWRCPTRPVDDALLG
jgi:hypothetical protein